ncbi:MAG: alpha/beta fold hydrolase [Cyclobacteriaceae bacterium]
MRVTKFALVLTMVQLVTNLHAQEVTITLDDGYQVKGHVSTTSKAAPSVLLIHQCNRTQEMWKPMVDELSAAGYNTLTVDMRGYGKSVSDKYNIETQDYDFVTQHFKLDIDAINEFWRNRLPDSEFRVAIGASCGGALASKTAIKNDDIKALVLISPSFRAHWIEKEYRKQLGEQDELPILAIASEDDLNAMTYIDEAFVENSSALTQKIVYKKRMHGEPLFAHDPKLIPYVIDWIDRATK